VKAVWEERRQPRRKKEAFITHSAFVGILRKKERINIHIAPFTIQPQSAQT